MYRYGAKLLRVVDGDTADVMIDLGFDTWVKARLRFKGVDTWEKRTRDKAEKVKGLICNLEDSKIKIPMSSLDGVNLVVKNDMPMEINVAIFLPEDNLVWIKYFRW